MSLIGNETFALERLWAGQSIVFLNMYPDFFTKRKMRQARVQLIAGSNMLKGVKNWLESSQILTSGQRGECFVTDFGRRILENDKSMSNSATWWAIHLSICFSERGEPYISFFRSLDVFSKGWKDYDDVVGKIIGDLEDYSQKSIESNMSGVRSMFVLGGPLADLDLVRIKNEGSGTKKICLGSPEVPDAVIAFALALARYHKFPSRPSVNFSELEQIGLPHFLCLSPTQLRERLQTMSQSHYWRDHFTYTQVANLDSISFSNSLSKEKILIALLQSAQDTWM